MSVQLADSERREADRKTDLKKIKKKKDLLSLKTDKTCNVSNSYDRWTMR